MLADDILKTEHDTEVFMNGFALGSSNGMSKKAIIQQLSVTSNGEYETPDGVDGFNPVTVNVPLGFTLYDIINFPTIAEYSSDSGNSRIEIKILTSGYKSVSIDINYAKPIMYHDNYLFYTVWYYKNTPLLAVPINAFLYKKIDYRRRDNDKKMYIWEIDIRKELQFSASELPAVRSKNTYITLDSTFTFDRTTFHQDGTQAGHGEDTAYRSVNIYLFREHDSFGSTLTSIDNNTSGFTESIDEFYSDFEIQS